jgi:hypothetical protein
MKTEKTHSRSLSRALPARGASAGARRPGAVHRPHQLSRRSLCAGGTGIFGGLIDYIQMINERDGGINGVKLTWEECETEYNNARGVECYERSEEVRGDRPTR